MWRVLLLSVPALLLVAVAGAAGGALDRSFGSGGKVLTDFGGKGSNDCALAVAIQRDGKIVAAGFSKEAGRFDDFALARYTTKGTLDRSFGSGGKVTTDISGRNNDEAFAVAIQADGKIVAGDGETREGVGRSDFALARYLANGRLDRSFGSRGKVLTGVRGTPVAGGDAVALQGDGKIVAAGWSGTASCAICNDFALIRYTTKGTLDRSFGSGGKVTTDISGRNNDEAFAVAIQADGKIVAAGFSEAREAGRFDDFALVHYTTKGTLDRSFGSGGKVTTAFSGGNDDSAGAVAIQRDGKIVAAGWSKGAGRLRDFALARYLAR